MSIRAVIEFQSTLVVRTKFVTMLDVAMWSHDVYSATNTYDHSIAMEMKL